MVYWMVLYSLYFTTFERKGYRNDRDKSLIEIPKRPPLQPSESVKPSDKDHRKYRSLKSIYHRKVIGEFDA